MVIYSVLSTFAFFEIIEKNEKKRLKKTLKFDGKSMEKHVQNGYLHRGIQKNGVFHFVSALGTTPGRFWVPPGVTEFHIFLKSDVQRDFSFFLLFHVVLHVV